MVSGFRRSMSLPGSNPQPSPKRRAEKPYHVRSTSLPCRSHPLISHLEDEIRSIRTWQSHSDAGQNPSTAWLIAGMCYLELLLASLDDIFQLPQTIDSLRSRRSSAWAENLLEDFLRFADAYGSLRSALISLQQIQSAAQVDLRRRSDETRLASHSRSMKKVEKEIARLASAIRDIGKSADPALVDGVDAELAGILREIKSVTVAVSATVLSGMVTSTAAATSAVTAPSRSSWMALRTRLRSSSSPPLSPPRKSGSDCERALERLEALEECVKGLELGCERVYRGLIHTRVTLLNILTP